MLNELLNRLKRLTERLKFPLDAMDARLGQKVPRLNITLGSLLLCVAISVYTIVFSYFTILRHHFFQSSGWDLGIYMQSLYTTGFKGELLGYTIEKFTVNPSGSFLGTHFSPFLFLLVPLYRLAPYAEMLLIIQSFVLASGAYGLHLISYHVFQNRFVSTSLALSYLLYTPLQTMEWFDFHLQAFIPIFFFLMFYFYIKKDYVKSLVFFVLVLSTIEIMPILVFPFGLYCVLANRKDRKALIYAITVMCVSIAWFFLASFVKVSLNPMYSTTFGAWRIWGNSYQEILVSVISRPVDIILYFFTVFPLEKALYFLWFLAPLFFLPLLARKEFILLVMPWIVLVFLSAYLGYFTNQYAAFVAPQVFIATVYGLKQVSKSASDEVFKKSLVMRYGKWILCGTIITFILIGPFGLVPQAREIYIHGLPADNPHKEALRNALQLIPDNASVYTSFSIASHLSNRLELYAHAIPDEPPDYIVIDLKSRDSSISLGILGGAPIVGLDQLLTKYNYALIMSNDGILIYKISPPNGSIPQPIMIFFDYKDLILDFGNLVADNSSQSSTVLSHGPNDWSNGFWHGPYIALPQGRYEVICRLKSDGVLDGHMLTLDVTSDSGQNLLARKYVYGHDLAAKSWNDIILQFSVEEPKVSVEFRGIYASNSTTQYLDFIELKQFSPTAEITSGTMSFNHNDLSVVQGNVTADDLVFHEGNDSEAFFLGLSVKIPPGAFTVNFWLKVDMLSQGQVFSISVDDFDKTNLAQTEISVEDFTQRELWQCFSLDFLMSNSTSVVEIRGIGNKNASVSFSYLELGNHE